MPIAAMTFSDLIAAVRVEINEPVEGFWKDVDIKRWLNEGNADLVRFAKIDGPLFSFATVKDVESYALPTNFFSMRKVERETAAGSTYFTNIIQQTIDSRMEVPGAPLGYYIYANRLYLNPRPDTAYNIQCFYFLDAVALVGNGDVPSIDSNYHNLIWLYATMRAKRRDDDPAFQTYLTDYETGRLAMTADTQNRRQSEGFDVVRDDWARTR